jgi:hypothetical protein
MPNFLCPKIENSLKRENKLTIFKLSTAWKFMEEDPNTGPALEVQIEGEFPLKSKIWRPKPKYLVRIRAFGAFFPLAPA